MRRLEDKVALVTGAAGGIGRATVKLFLEEGAKVAASDLQAPQAIDSVLALAQDVTREADWRKALAAVEEHFGRFDLLVNNAGIALVEDLENTSLEDWRRTMAVNLDGTFLGIKHGIAALKAHGGVIVNVASVAGIVAAPLLGAYATAKGGVRALTKSAAIHCTDKGYDIRINSLHPGFTDTAMLEGFSPVLGGGDAVRQKLARRQPMGRLARPEEVAEAILYLASEQSSYMTGGELVLDGGFSAQ